MGELEFIERIDCQFPYDRPVVWRQLSAQAARMSPNAAFMLIHEACRPPRSLAPNQARAIVRHLRRRFRHPLYRVAEPAIQAHISGHPLRQFKAASLMRRVAAYAGQYNALALCYMSANDRAGLLERTYNHVVSKWR